MSYQKFRAKKTIVDDIVFASKLEAARYIKLKALEKAGEICDLVLQPEFQIAHGYVDPKTGKKVKSVFYVADFEYVDIKTHLKIVEDTKGDETDVFKLKWKLVQPLYRDREFRKLKDKDVW